MKWLNERGDTLVEVTIALAILAMVLTGAFVTANKAFSLGQDAKERSQLASAAQQQAEALQSFRDSYKWSEFLNGRSAAGIPGVLVQTAAAGNCVGAVACFHMEQKHINGLDQWVPVAGVQHDAQIGGGLSYIQIVGRPGATAGYDFTLTYGVPARGGGQDLKNSMWLHLTNLDGLRQ